MTHLRVKKERGFRVKRIGKVPLLQNAYCFIPNEAYNQLFVFTGFVVLTKINAEKEKFLLANGFVKSYP